MSTYAWRLPGAPAPIIGSPTTVKAFGATLRSALGGYYDIALDPVSKDYVETEEGEWLETADSRTAAMIALDTRFGLSPFDPNDGTMIQAELENDNGDPVTPEFVLSETLRSLGRLVKFGMIADLSGKIRDSKGNLIVNETGIPTCVLDWRDLASGSPVDMNYSPEG